MRLLVLLLVVVTAAAVDAQGSPGGGPEPSRQAQRRIDPLTAAIQGRVTAADSGTPIRRAEVRATSDGGISRLATSDADGRFELRDLPAGQYRLNVSKSGFVSLGYGQRRPFEAAGAISVAEGQRAAVNFALPRGGAIAGRVLDEAGEPLANVRVQALRPRTLDGRRRLLASGPVDVSDDTGAFRLYGLAPGDYYVSATPPRTDMPLQMAAPLAPSGRPPVANTSLTFHPGTPSFQEAQRVTLVAGGEARADIQLGLAPAATVSGVVLTSSGAPAPDATVTLRSDAVALGVSAVLAGPPPLSLLGHTAPDGTFSVPAVPPGPYTLQATVQDLTLPPLMGGEAVSVPLVVAGSDVTGLTVVTMPPVVLEGTFVADTGVARPLPPRLGVTARSLHGGQSMMNSGGNGTFRVVGSSGGLQLQVNNLPDEWAVKSILVNGVETIDTPIVARGVQKADVRIVLTDRLTEVSGSISDSPPAGADEGRNYDVVVFADDPAKWTYPSRFVRTVRTSTDGSFRIVGLPGNERYLAVALDYLEDGEGGDPDFLERVRAGATAFTLGDAERRTIDLRLLRR